ncbi:FimD/PapC N-terminal domain-containing protein, partial [Serratia marcescens]
MFDVRKATPLPARWCCALLALPLGCAAADGYTFDPALLRGSVLSNSALSQFNQQDAVAPGSYQIDLYLNGQFLERDQIRFVRAGKQVLPCFDRPQLTRFGLKNPPAAAEAECLLPGRDLKDIAVNADISRLRLDLSIPQALLNGQPRGSVNPASLDSGETMAFVNYNLNQYHVSYRQGQTRDLDSTYANLNGGFNLG